MQRFLQRYTWLILLAGALIQILTGIPSAWGTFQKPVMQAYEFSEQAAGYGFSILLASYGIGCAIGGFFQDKCGPRKAAFAGTALLCAGVALGGITPAGQPWLFYLAFSVPAGVGSAFLYPAVMSCAQKWYADKKGLATGVIGGAMGLSGLFLTGFVGLFTKGIWQSFGIRGAFLGLALCMLPICLVGSFLLQNPPEDTKQNTKKQTGLAPKQMIRTANYWYLAGAVALSTPAVQLFKPDFGRNGNTAWIAGGAGTLGGYAGKHGQCGWALIYAVTQRQNRTKKHRPNIVCCVSGFFRMFLVCTGVVDDCGVCMPDGMLFRFSRGAACICYRLVWYGTCRHKLWVAGTGADSRQFEFPAFSRCIGVKTGETRISGGSGTGRICGNTACANRKAAKTRCRC